MKRIFAALLTGGIFLASCAAPTPLPVSAPPTSSPTSTCSPTPPPATFTPAPSATFTPAPNYQDALLTALPHADDSCLPDKTADDLGIYIYDLTHERELISINPDVPFQFASAFKAPVLSYFLSQCKTYWDTESAEWQAHFLNLEDARNIPFYTSAEYRALLAAELSDVRNWDNIESFFESHRAEQNGVSGAIDKRYFILSKVYAMIARSNNAASAEVLKFVHENCAPVQPPALTCYQPNDISAFNAWFNAFSGISYTEGESQRGLFNWDSVMEKNAAGQSVETRLATFGQQDSCVTSLARLNCSATYGANVWTARDFFRFYNALASSADTRLKNTALALLSLDVESPSRGNLKNLARRMGAASMSKNGHAFFIQGSINTDAGIFVYKDTVYIIVVLGYDAQPSLSLLYGDYSPKGEPLTEQSLLRDLLMSAP